MLADHFPPAGLRLKTPRLELRLPSPDQLGALAALAVEGVHDPARMPFVSPWTDAEPAEVVKTVLQHHWSTWASWTADNWTLNLAVLHDGTVVGQQSLGASDLAITREVNTGSWLGLRHHGRGIGTEMRAAVLHLAFAGLGADEAQSIAFDHNAASLGVSRKLGYQPDGIKRRAVRGARQTDLRLRLTREEWERHRTVPVEMAGLAPCQSWFGL
jgi:RimJ/RimL family protein N-acetyltransferase